jgi:hypothetical protein
MAAALLGLQPAQTSINLLPQYPRPPYFWDLGPVPEGTLFIDPVNSTHSAAAYVDGPQLTYEPRTGSASLLAPPMLGLADEFGIRSLHSPRSVTLLFGESRVANPELPQLTSFERNYVSGLSDEASFWKNDYGPAGFELAVGGTHFTFEVATISGFGGFQLNFQKWLQPGLNAAAFAIPEPPTPQPGQIFIIPIGGAPLPIVGAVVEYGYTLGFPNIYYLGGENVLANVIIIPEPSSAAVGFWAVIFAGMKRRRC